MKLINISKYHRFIQIFILLASFILMPACKDSSVEEPENSDSFYPSDNAGKVTIQQGVWGNVWFWEGSFMPNMSGKTSGKITAVSRDIYIFEPTKNSMTTIKSPCFYKEINTKFITKISSDKSGFFQVSLPIGQYSFFVKEDSLYFANETDGNYYIQSCVVSEGKVTKRQINIDYKTSM